MINQWRDLLFSHWAAILEKIGDLQPLGCLLSVRHWPTVQLCCHRVYQVLNHLTVEDSMILSEWGPLILEGPDSDTVIS